MSVNKKCHGSVSKPFWPDVIGIKFVPPKIMKFSKIRNRLSRKRDKANTRPLPPCLFFAA